MRLERLEAVNFRNIERVNFLPSENMSVISGQNGQGKTNLLECIWLLTGAKSFRAAKDCELIKKGCDFAQITAVIDDDGNKKDIEIIIAADTKNNRTVRRAKLNGVLYNRAFEIAGTFNCVVFSPEHLSLVKGAPEGRRKFIDTTLCQLYTAYLENLRLYQRLLLQKNSMLKLIKKNGYDYREYDSLINTFDEQLAESGAVIADKRKKYIDSILVSAKENYYNISGKKESFDCVYLNCCDKADNPKELYKAFCACRTADYRAGFSTFGIHREDIKILINGEESKIFSSQGQQRSAVLSLKIAEAQYIQSVTGAAPVLLLDDVLSELDSTRQDFLLNKIENQQVFVTGCDSNLFSKTNGKIFKVENGSLTQ